MSDIIHGDSEDFSNQMQLGDDHAPTPTPPDQRSPSPDHMNDIDPNNMFSPLNLADANMNNRLAPVEVVITIDQLCTSLQSELKLDPDHLKIALSASKCTPEARHASIIFSNAAFHQLSMKSLDVGSTPHVFDDRFRDFVRVHARMYLLDPTLEAYSNNPLRNGALPRSLYFLTLDAIDQQSDEWKEDHLAPGQLNDDPVALDAYREALGELLKHQRSNLRTLLLANILETQRISIKGSVPNRQELLTSIYQELPPRNNKMTTVKIQAQVTQNWAMRLQMCYARLVMVHYYVHKSRKTSQWLEIDERLATLRTSSREFQKHHAHLVFQKDQELFSKKLNFSDIPKENFTVPTLDAVRISLASPLPLNL
ncbi:hypothetical protein PGT21_020604 [Puccinia graminis f. sp. tritici]|uniref:Uncharacterized protein n=1 Tax=Puccinia graminis f. sp. tritici TaxID=56615 RepID=A0A5B0NNW7_PUCGR|nr:hypothetical protein PGT21_020604 [Puccinia graminis f. sp. tritici]KAA1125395.1 hypothetical protein PGTUg99_002076 [Puccinia graminis f. sp. tritici]